MCGACFLVVKAGAEAFDERRVDWVGRGHLEGIGGVMREEQGSHYDDVSR